MLFDRAGELDELEVVLRRVAFGARLLGLGWWATLSALVLVEGAPRPWVPAFALAAALGWAGVTTVAYRRRADAITSRGVLAVDTLLAVSAIAAPGLAGVPVLFYGGFPFIVVVVAAVRSRAAAWAVATILGLVVGVQLVVTGRGEGAFAFPVSQVAVYFAGAYIVSWALRVVRRSEDERREAQQALASAEAARARAEERAGISRHLHDSVLQTLALIQRASDRPAEVVSLARGQEHDLRSWLYGGAREEGAGLVELVRREAAEVELRYGVTVETVSVGDAPPSPAVEALVAAAREAMVNAARHSGTGLVSVYTEAGDGFRRVYVRDRGVGFDPEAVAQDRRGIAESIKGRIASVGGSAGLRTGRGTEWALEVPG